jgi:hypothetical protein
MALALYRIYVKTLLCSEFPRIEIEFGQIHACQQKKVFYAIVVKVKVPPLWHDKCS